MRLWDLFSLVGTALVLLLTLSSGLFSVQTALNPPMEFLGASATQKVVRPGDKVDVEFRFRKNTDCGGKARPEWEYADGRRLIEDDRDLLFGYMPNPPSLTRRYEVPSNAPPGLLKLQRTGYTKCYLEPQVPFVMGPIWFMVVEEAPQ